MCRYFPEDTAYAVLSRETDSINYSNSIEVVTAVFEKITILCFGAPMNGHYFWNYNVQ
jgi:hypothetical protein